HRAPCRRWIFLRDVLRFCVQIRQRRPQPSNAHGEPTSSPPALLRSRLQTLLGPPPPALCESLQSASRLGLRNPGSLRLPGTTVIAASPSPACLACSEALRRSAA